MWISKTTIDNTALNSPDLSNIKELYLTSVGLTEMPYLSNLASLKCLCLSGNQIKHVSLQSYFDAETGGSTMPNLRCLSLSRTPISKIDARIKEVFPNLRTLIVQDLKMIDASLPFSNMKDQLDEADIQLIEPGEKKENERMPRTD
ncbi:uncharacterized protein VICG_01444 [Vittaforma corneae ATCC 50505]|uniref:U2A'/phosphoprotein 32 family A C-terminal domain-containing protein n=1 Tax=Vittaforma corneae (strain ATCC 50505) TaxID=993615 RepID=L2GM78_VITCO|nr:uncharacterized protein VICG_01444 [Vittaforma corneae ATCC 50505]ELA41580.1 hypothetical protein VICG_01444 [Vittaforma corneae ATCC 50505]